MAISIYDTPTLIATQSVMRPFSAYWLQFYPGTLTFETETIMFDQVMELRRMAPFVSPNTEGRVMKELGFTTQMFSPAYVKPKHVISPEKLISRQAGEALLGGMTRQERYDAAVARNLSIEKDMVQRRWEWMAAKATIDGAVTVTGEDYPTRTVAFGRDASLTITLAGAAKWTAGTATPLLDIENARAASFELNRTPITRLTFGLTAWNNFIKFDEVLGLLDTRYRGSESAFNRAISEGEPYELRGVIEGQNGMGLLSLYTYNDAYDDIDGNSVQILDTDTVVGTGPGLAGQKCFGAIHDLDSLTAVDMFPKMWREIGDLSNTYTMTQSAPLMVPTRPNGSFSILTD